MTSTPEQAAAQRTIDAADRHAGEARDELRAIAGRLADLDHRVAAGTVDTDIIDAAELAIQVRAEFAAAYRTWIARRTTTHGSMSH